jgi:hypothetical protein
VKAHRFGPTGGTNLCPGTIGTVVELDESVDIDLTQVNGGGGINPSFLPRDPNHGCAPVFPHDYLRVNTIFEVVRASGGYTAWTDKHPSYEWTNGPSGKGVNDFFGPEINSIPVALPQFADCSPVPAPSSPTTRWIVSGPGGHAAGESSPKRVRDCLNCERIRVECTEVRQSGMPTEPSTASPRHRVRIPGQRRP